jgi:hypothetical protein
MRPVEDGKVSPKPRITLASKVLGGIIEGDDGAGLGLGILFLAAAAVIAASPCLSCHCAAERQPFRFLLVLGGG